MLCQLHRELVRQLRVLLFEIPGLLETCPLAEELLDLLDERELHLAQLDVVVGGGKQGVVRLDDGRIREQGSH